MIRLKAVLSPLRAFYLPLGFLILVAGCAPSSEQVGAVHQERSTPARTSNIIWPATKRYAEEVKKLPITPARAREMLLAHLGRDKANGNVTAQDEDLQEDDAQDEELQDEDAQDDEDHPHADDEDEAEATDTDEEQPSESASVQPDSLIPAAPSAIIAGQYFFGISGDDPTRMSGYLVDGKSGAIKYQKSRRPTTVRRRSSWRWEYGYTSYYPYYPNYYPYGYGYGYDYDGFGDHFLFGHHYGGHSYGHHGH